MIIKQNTLTIRNATTEDAATLGKWWRDGSIMAHADFQKLRVNIDSWKNQLGDLQSSVDYQLTRTDFKGVIK